MINKSFVHLFKNRYLLDSVIFLQEADYFMEKLGWEFWMERIGMLLLQFYAASDSVFCACIAWVILFFINLFTFIETRIPQMLAAYFDSVSKIIRICPCIEIYICI